MSKEIESKKLFSGSRQPEVGKTKSTQIEVPSISLPKGGGAIKGIDEKFSVNAVNGTSAFSIPVPFSNARGASPSISLVYNSGYGNGIFGLGWKLNISSIKRKTDNELPQYLDTIDSDTYVFSEVEDLVPEFKKENDGGISKNPDGTYLFKENDSPDGQFTIRFYKPRIEGLFSRIERWTGKSSKIIKWRVITKDNVSTLFGWTLNSRLNDPSDPGRIFAWYPEFVFDDKGNCSQYIYIREDSTGFPDSFQHNRNRIENGLITYTNLYIGKILYGNRTPCKPFIFPPQSDYCFQTVFDYGEYNTNAPFNNLNPWNFRQDAFSEYKAGFEIRTTRLCNRILLFHFFSELPEGKALVKSLNFGYDTSGEEGFTFLKSITSVGYMKKPDLTYTLKELPPHTFEYQRHAWNKELKSISSKDLADMPSGMDESQFQYTDLFNEGLPGILTEQGGGWYYKKNLGDGKFENARLISHKPSFSGLGSQLQLMDLDGDAVKQLVSYHIEPRGYYELNDKEEWLSFRSFEALPNINMADPNARMVDLNGDGKPEVLITEDNVFTWYESLGRKGFKEATRTFNTFNEENTPHIVFAEPKQTIFLADMSGDGLSDLVRIRNSEVCYWPNLGFGKFGRKVTMEHSPVFDHPDLFDPTYLRLADIDGSGTTDIIYLGKNRITCWINLSGNAFSNTSFELDCFPEIHNRASVSVTDLLGNGLACIVWSSNLSKDSETPIKYIDLMNSKKPHLMVSYKNNMGKEVSLHYQPSTRFYLMDKLAGNPWVTKLHFPVHCIDKVVIRDNWRGSEFATKYSYHHGHYDHTEREFRGFGRVEQVDTESFGTFTSNNHTSPYITNDQAFYQPPVKTITWYHTGAFIDPNTKLSLFGNEYFPDRMETLQPGKTGISRENKLAGYELKSLLLTTDERLEAIRACKGMMLRQEVYELENDALLEGKEIPVKLFTTADHSCHIRCLQGKLTNKYSVFHVSESENITYHYELDLLQETMQPDPRIAHTLNLKTDEYGNILQSVSAVYARKGTHAEPLLSVDELSLINNTQTEKHLVFTERIFSKNDIIDSANDYRLRLPCENSTYELQDISPANTTCFTIAELRNYIISLPPKKLVERERLLYFHEDLSSPEPFGEINSLGILYETYKLALTNDLLTSVFDTRSTYIKGDFLDHKFSGYISGNELSNKLGSDTSGQYWTRSGIAGFSSDAKEHFYLPERYTDAFGNTTTLQYDEKYDLFIQSSKDPAGNTFSVAQFDYRVLQPSRMKDINDNLSEVVFDILGMPAAMALLGKGTEGDNLAGFDDALINPSTDRIIDFFTGNYNENTSIQWLDNATSRYIYYFGETEAGGKTIWAAHPSCACSILREVHFAGSSPGQSSPLQVTFECSDGSGTVLLKKIEAEPEVTGGPLRWIASEKTILNNKGKPVKQYEPYFSDQEHRFEEAAEIGVTPIMYYDSMGRLVRKEFPDGSYSRTLFSPWHVVNFDPNDTLLETGNKWYAKRTSLSATTGEKLTVEKTELHAGTPAETILDSLGREIITIAHNKYKDIDDILHEEKYLTFSKLDIKGNLLWICDARKNLVVQHVQPLLPANYMHLPGNHLNEGLPGGTSCYDYTGNLLYLYSMDAGERWVVNDGAGNPMYACELNKTPGGTDITDFIFQTTYDVLQRPIEQWLTIGEAKYLIEKRVYGEQTANAGSFNLRGRLHHHYDQGGLITNTFYDFKGNPREVQKKLIHSYKAPIINWQENSPTSLLEPETFTHITEYDALNRITRLFNWHQGTGSRVAVYEPFYNQRGLLESEQLVLGATKTVNGNGYMATVNQRSTPVSSIGYDAKGQRQKILYGNGTRTRYNYDPQTFRLVQMRTTGPGYDPLFPGMNGLLTDSNVLQNLHYLYDPVGNIIEIYDGAFKPAFFNNEAVKPECQYIYDALYRLIFATGRENNMVAPPQGQFPVNTTVLRDYREFYTYDKAGNIVEMRHVANGGGWTRRYASEDFNNRLQRTWEGSANWDDGQATNKTTYQYDLHGNMLNLSDVGSDYFIHWDYRKMISHLDLGGGGRAFYTYDSNRERTRKVRETIDGHKLWERSYLGGLEIYRRYSGGALVEEIETLHLMDGNQRVLLVDQVIKTDNNQLNPGTRFAYQYSNHLGSSAMELDGTASIISYEEYHPFGTTAYKAKNNAITAVAKRYRFTGKEKDEESGLYYYGARFYACWLGRWTACDPAGRVDGANLYVYTRNNPVILTDPNGMQATGRDRRLLTVTPLLTLGSVDASGSGPGGGASSGQLSLTSQVRSSFMLNAPVIGLNTTGLMEATAATRLDYETGTGQSTFRGGALVGTSSGLHLTMGGSGSSRFSFRGDSSPDVSTDARMHAALSYSSFSLATGSGSVSVDSGRFTGSFDASTVANIGRLHVEGSGRMGSDGTPEFERLSVRARVGLPGLLTLNARATGTTTPEGSLAIKGSADLNIMGIPSLHIQGSGFVTSRGALFSGTFSGPGPLCTSFITGDFRLSTRYGISANALVLGATYAPSASINDPASLTPGTLAAAEKPKTPWTPGGLIIGAGLYNYSQGNLSYIAAGLMPDLSSNIFSNIRFGITIKTHFDFP